MERAPLYLLSGIPLILFVLLLGELPHLRPKLVGSFAEASDVIPRNWCNQASDSFLELLCALTSLVERGLQAHALDGSLDIVQRLVFFNK